jgi:hypothetical protein
VSNDDELRAYATSCAQRLLAEKEAKDKKLGLYKGLSTVATTTGIIVPLVLGSALFTAGAASAGVAVQSDPDNLLKLGGGVLGLHKGLGCESYHAKWGHWLNRLHSIIEGYRATARMSGDELLKTIEAQDKKLEELREVTPI